MKKIKYLFVLILPFILCGCNAEYNLEIVDDEYKEELNVTASEDNSTNLIAYDMSIKQYNDFYLEKPIPASMNITIFSEDNKEAEGVKYYQKEDLTTEDITGIKFKNTFTKEEYEKSRIVNESYNRFLIGTIDGNVVLSTGEVFKYFKEVPILDTVTVNIKTNHKVIKNNADEVKDNVYTWYITKDNYENKPIEFQFSKEEKVSNYDNVIGKTILKVVIIIISIILVLGLAALFIFVKHKRSNKL